MGFSEECSTLTKCTHLYVNNLYKIPLQRKDVFYYVIHFSLQLTSKIRPFKSSLNMSVSLHSLQNKARQRNSKAYAYLLGS